MAENRSPKEITLPTPFGEVSLPVPTLPPLLKRPTIDERRRDIIKHTIASDLAFIPAQIPIIGDVVADVIEDLHGKEKLPLARYPSLPI
ncbi:hypothetical protein KKA69_04830 [Patescibacteria group bacterium]|nr:hypothetical protein [Patescibacteria group bacterium]